MDEIEAVLSSSVKEAFELQNPVVKSVRCGVRCMMSSAVGRRGASHEDMFEEMQAVVCKLPNTTRQIAELLILKHYLLRLQNSSHSV